MGHEADPYLFKVDGFSFNSKTSTIFLLLCLVLSGGGVAFLVALPIILICTNGIYPGLYKNLTRRIIILSNNRIVRYLSFIPKIEFNGEWFQTLRPQKKQITNLSEVLKFVQSNIYEITTIHLIFLVFALRFGYAFQGSEPSNNSLFYGFTTISLTIAFMVIPILVGFYFVTVWTVRDMGLKLYRISESTIGTEKEFEEVFELSDSVKSLSGFLFGFPSVLWVVRFADSNQFDPLPNLPTTVNALVFLGIMYFLTIGITIFTLIFYYRGARYQFTVNELREWLRYSSKDVVSRTTSVTPQVMVTNQQQRQERSPMSRPQPNKYQHDDVPLKQPSEQSETNAQTRKVQNFCNYCGNQLKTGQKFCVQCGKKL